MIANARGRAERTRMASEDKKKEKEREKGGEVKKGDEGG